MRWWVLALAMVWSTAFAARDRTTLVVDVSDPDGRPIAGATVLVDGDDAGTTDTSGRLVVSDVRPDRQIDLRVDKPRSAWAPVTQRVTLTGADGVFAVTLPRSAEAARLPGELTIVAVDPAGRPVPGASVVVDGLEKGRTGPDGALLYAGRRAGATLIVAVKAVERPLGAVTTVDVLGGPQLAIVTLAPEVEDASEVAMAADVAQPTTGDRDGDGRPDRKDACPDAPETYNGYEDRDGCPDALATLVVWALDDAGTPVPDAVVRVDGTPVGKTGPDGSLALAEERPGGSLVPSVEAADHEPATAGRVRLEEGRHGVTLVLHRRDTDGDGIVDLRDRCPREAELPNGFRDDDGCPDDLASLSVLVVDPDGEAVAGADVRVDGGAALQTGPEGRVLLTGLVPSSRISVHAEATGLAPGGVGAYDVRDGTQSLKVALQHSAETLAAAPELTVLAVEPPNGRPVPYAAVSIDGQRKGHTDRSGAFRFVGRSAGAELVVALSEPGADRVVSTVRQVTLRGGPQRVRLWLGGASVDPDAVSDTDSDDDGAVDTFDRCPNAREVFNGYLDGDGCPDELATLALSVTDPDGAPVAGAVIYADGRDAGRTDRDGRLAVTGLVPGVVVPLDVAKPGTDLVADGRVLQDLVEGAQALSVVLRWQDTDGDGVRDSLDRCPARAEVVNGYLDDDGCPDKLALVIVEVVLDGTPISGAAVRIGDEQAGVTGGDGKIRLRDLLPGTTVVVSADGGGGATGRLEITLIEGAQPHSVVLSR